VILSCQKTGFLEARIQLDEARLLALDPFAEVSSLREALEAIPRLCAGGPGAGNLASMSLRERFHWLVAPRSAVIQTSPVHTGRTTEPQAVIDHLFETMVGGPRRAASPDRG